MSLHRQWLACLAVSLTVITCTGQPAAAQNFKWWQNGKFQQELALSDEQISRLEETFQSLQPTLKTQKDILDKLEARLSAAVDDPQADEARLLPLLDRVESARSDLSKSRTLLLFRMRRILTREQDVKMKALHAQWVREGRNRNSQRPPAGQNR